ncbi:MAG: hypothetical protein RLZZ283_648 [Candidatus Parcubacteria bacterium]|jgi:hypothetical protein
MTTQEQKRPDALDYAIQAFKKTPRDISSKKRNKDVKKFVARKSDALQGFGFSVTERRRRHAAGTSLPVESK